MFVLYVLQIVQCALYNSYFIVYTVHCTLYTVHCTLYIVDSTEYIVQCTICHYYNIKV